MSEKGLVPGRYGAMILLFWLVFGSIERLADMRKRMLKLLWMRRVSGSYMFLLFVCSSVSGVHVEECHLCD